MARYNKPNNGEHIHDIIFRTACDKHDAPVGKGCFLIYYDRGGTGDAICGKRVAIAGFNGKVTSNSLSRTKKDR